MKMGDAFVRDSESQFWKDWRATAEANMSEFPPEWREQLIDVLGKQAVDTARELLNEFEVYLDREIERSRRMGHALKSAMSALRAMRADGIADDLAELLTSILRDQPAPATSGDDITPVDQTALKWRDVNRGTVPLPKTDFTAPLDSDGRHPEVTPGWPFPEAGFAPAAPVRTPDGEDDGE